MKKKGFTLVELLAVIVLLGILMTLGIPTVMNLVGKNRNKSYIEDAKRLIAQAEYKLRADSLKIDVPDYDDIIVFSFDYLDDGSFSESPNKGKYIPEYSYVAVKIKKDGNLYGVNLVEGYTNNSSDDIDSYLSSDVDFEKIKFKGVKFSTLDQLNSRDYNSRVQVFNITKGDYDNLASGVVDTRNNLIKSEVSFGENCISIVDYPKDDDENDVE